MIIIILSVKLKKINGQCKKSKFKNNTLTALKGCGVKINGWLTSEWRKKEYWGKNTVQQRWSTVHRVL